SRGGGCRLVADERRYLAAQRNRPYNSEADAGGARRSAAGARQRPGTGARASGRRPRAAARATRIRAVAEGRGAEANDWARKVRRNPMRWPARLVLVGLLLGAAFAVSAAPPLCSTWILLTPNDLPQDP